MRRVQKKGRGEIDDDFSPIKNQKKAEKKRQNRDRADEKFSRKKNHFWKNRVARKIAAAASPRETF